MAFTRPAGALQTIDELTLKLALHNSGQAKLPDSELATVLHKLRGANTAVGLCLNDPPRRKKVRDNDMTALEQYIQIFAAAGLISLFIITFGILLHGVFQMMAMSMTTMHPGP